MSGRTSSTMLYAIILSRAPNMTISAAARAAGVHVVSLRRALRKAGEPPRPQPKGDAVSRRVTAD